MRYRSWMCPKAPVGRRESGRIGALALLAGLVLGAAPHPLTAQGEPAGGGRGSTPPFLAGRETPQGARWADAPSSVPGQPARGDSGQAAGPLTLARAVALALETHPAVAQAQAAADAAEAGVRQAKSARLPWLTSQASLALHQEPMVVAPIHAFDPMNPPAFDQNLLQGAVTLGYTVYDGGGRGARIRRAEAGEGAARAGGSTADMEVVVGVSAAYLGILSGGDVLEAVLGQKLALASEVERVRQFLEEGKAARVDLLRVEAAMSRAEAAEIAARADLELAQSRLARLTGLPVDEVRGATLTRVAGPETALPSADSVLSYAQSVNPELSRARMELAGASAGVREVTATWLPKVEAGGRYTDFGTLTGGHVQEWQGLLQISYPLFSGGSRTGERARAQAEERRAAEGLRLAELNVADEAETALAAVREAGALREALELAEAQSEEVARIEALALEAGAGVQTDFLRAEAELFQARAALAQARHREILARIQLARVQGDLTLGWIQENMEVVR